MRRQWGYYLMWLGLLLVAGGLRLYAPDWDGGLAAHPDERFLVGVAQTVPLYHNLCRSVPDFPYGHLPVTLARLLVLAAPDADPLFAARSLSALAGWLLVVLSGAVARDLVPSHWGQRGARAAALLAAAMATFAPFLIQQANFYTVDPLASALACGAVLAGARHRFGLAGMLAGLAVACKLSSGLIVPALLVAQMWTWRRTRTRLYGALAGVRDNFLSLSLGLILAFAVASPWSLITPVACWRGPIVQSMMAAGRFDFPYTRQYAKTWPYLYPVVQMGLWGLGPGVTLAGLGGILVGHARKLRWRALTAWVWTVLYFVAVGGLAVKFPRYMLPLYPWWVAWAARVLVGLWRRAGRTWWTGLIVSAVVLPTIGLGLAQVSVYARAHPWIEASRWLYDHGPSGGTVAVEAWDHPLPVPLPSGSPDRFAQVTVPVFAEDGADKAQQLAAAEEAAVIILASRRGYGALSRLPARYPMTLAWYAELFAMRPVRTFTRCPQLGPLALTDDPLLDAGLLATTTLAQRCGTPFALRLPRLDESFRVYDAPMTVLLTVKPEL
jgi:hypothetical protein